jgi:FKBP-type peptidyl-prolyl cis-trans isomerase FklB
MLIGLASLSRVARRAGGFSSAGNRPAIVPPCQFADLSGQCDNACMQKRGIKTATLALFAAGTMLLAEAGAQQTAPSTSSQSQPQSQSQSQTQTPAAKSPAAKSPATSATKPKPATTTSKAPLTLKTDKDKASYAIGMNIGKSLHRDSVDVDPNIIARGLKDALAGGKTLLTDDEAKAAMIAMQTELRKQQQAKMEATSESNKKEGEAFLASNKTQEGVVTLPDGLQYKVLKEGTGPKPQTNDSVVCNYRGTLLDKTEFDSSYKRGQPATFRVGQVIKGWNEALQLMPVGSKWQLFIPSDLAYGPRGAGGVIGPNATLVFEVELLSIQDKPPVPVPAQGNPQGASAGQGNPNPTNQGNPSAASQPAPAASQDKPQNPVQNKPASANQDKPQN